MSEVKVKLESQSSSYVRDTEGRDTNWRVLPPPKGVHIMTMFLTCQKHRVAWRDLP